MCRLKLDLIRLRVLGVCDMGRVGQVGVGISLLQVCALVAGYGLMEPAVYVPLFNVLSLFTALQVLNSTLHFFHYMAVAKSTLTPTEDVGMGALEEALLVAA